MVVVEVAEGTQGVVVHLGGVGGGRQVGGEDSPGEGKQGREEEGEVVEVVAAVAAGGVLGLEVVSHPCHHQRSPYPLRKNMEKPVGYGGESQRAPARAP